MWPEALRSDTAGVPCSGVGDAANLVDPVEDEADAATSLLVKALMCAAARDAGMSGANMLPMAWRKVIRACPEAGLAAVGICRLTGRWVTCARHIAKWLLVLATSLDAADACCGMDKTTWPTTGLVAASAGFLRR